MRPTDQLRQDQVDAIAEAFQCAAEEVRAFADTWAEAWSHAVQKADGVSVVDTTKETQ